MLEPSIWYGRSLLANEAARRELEADNLPGAANRAYFSLHAFLIGTLIEMGQAPPIAHGNWPHAQLDVLIRSHLKKSFHKRLTMLLLDRLRRLRICADYGDYRELPKESLDQSLRELAQVLGSRER